MSSFRLNHLLSRSLIVVYQTGEFHVQNLIVRGVGRRRENVHKTREVFCHLYIAKSSQKFL